ncbi:hypothetical protein SEPCBS119000_001653 [Sporothrix epigloea]|uniref:Uncharacterized protein n=1 Tax=Sporothrix epigloea TaxID=1892477 RepID=A0ABP0DBW0_9PEZI
MLLVRLLCWVTVAVASPYGVYNSSVHPFPPSIGRGGYHLPSGYNPTGVLPPTGILVSAPTSASTPMSTGDSMSNLATRNATVSMAERSLVNATVDGIVGLTSRKFRSKRRSIFNETGVSPVNLTSRNMSEPSLL